MTQKTDTYASRYDKLRCRSGIKPDLQGGVTRGVIARATSPKVAWYRGMSGGRVTGRRDYLRTSLRRYQFATYDTPNTCAV